MFNQQNGDKICYAIFDVTCSIFNILTAETVLQNVNI